MEWILILVEVLMQRTSVDFQNATISFTGASISGLQSTINAVDVHHKTTANNGEVLSWNGTDYDWVASSRRW